MSRTVRHLRALGRAVVVATALAGVVGVARQRAEAVAVREGRLPAASASRVLEPARAQPAIAHRIAAWVPTPPRSPAGRVLAAAWAGPMTVVGFALALLAGRRPRWSPEHACFVAVGIGGPSGLALRSVGADANTVGQVVLCRQPVLSDALLAHEVVHVRQSERLGPLLLPAYVWLGACFGYRDNPLERAARAGAAAALTPPSAPAR